MRRIGPQLSPCIKHFGWRTDGIKACLHCQLLREVRGRRKAAGAGSEDESGKSGSGHKRSR
jgi:hypothetical protein